MRVHQKDFKSLVGKPYDLANCWDIVREFYMLVFQMEIKTYYHEVPETREATQSLIYTAKGDFNQVDGPPEFGDIILFEIRGIESHIGVYVGEGKFLHSSKTTGSVIDRIDKWKNLIVGYFRHKAAG